jgi:hypothetical protein
MNASLRSEYTTSEIKEALDGISDLKAPGPDGMPTIFFKRFWETVWGMVQEEVVVNVLNGGEIPKGWNETTVVLIPKVTDPQHLKDLRPINLCNVLYKIISEVLTNRLKVFLCDIISPNQSAFVPGWLITDKLVVNEMTRYLQNRRRGDDGYLALKLDMSKAYDRVECDFVEAMLRKLGVDATLVNVQMRSVRSVRYIIKINGELTDIITPQKEVYVRVTHCPRISFLFVQKGSRPWCIMQKQMECYKEFKSAEGPHVCHTFLRMIH